MNALLSRIWTIEHAATLKVSAPSQSGLKPWICLQCRAKRGQRRSYRHRRALAQATVQQTTSDAAGYGDITIPSTFPRPTNESGTRTSLQWQDPNSKSGQEVENGGNTKSSPTKRPSWRNEGQPQSTVFDTDLIPGSQAAIRRNLALSLASGDPEQIITTFIAASRDPGGISWLSRATLTEILKTVASDSSIQRLIHVYRGLSPTQLKILRIEPIEEVLEGYLLGIKHLALVRREAGLALNVVDYTRLLRCAEIAGSGDAADGIWQDMQRDEVLPNVYCYNHYLGAKVNNGRFHEKRFGRNRVIPFNIMARKHEKLGLTFQDYRVGRGGIKQQCVAIFNDMVSKGVVADETTFRWVMRALAAEGDLKGVNAVLQRMWNANVLHLMSKPEDMLPPVKTYPPSSPFYPSPKILLDLVEIYGSNNQIATAMRVVDYFSRHYKLPITHDVWQKLFNWTFVLTTWRARADREIGASIGQLPLKSVENLWNTMTSPPYNVRQTMDMYHKFIKTLFRRDALKRMTLVMEDGQLLLRHLYKDYRIAQARLALAERFPTYTVTFAQTKAKLRADVRIKNLERRQAHLYVHQWVRWLLANTKGHAGPNKAWERRAIPDLIRKWGALVPTRVSYRTSEGRVEFSIREVQRDRARGRKELHERRIVSEREVDAQSGVYRRYMDRVGRPWDTGYGRGLGIVRRE